MNIEEQTPFIKVHLWNISILIWDIANVHAPLTSYWLLDDIWEQLLPDLNCSFKIHQIAECKRTRCWIICWLLPGNEPFMMLTALFCGRKTPFVIDLYVSPDFHGGVWKSGVGGARHVVPHNNFFRKSTSSFQHSLFPYILFYYTTVYLD